MNSKKPHVSHIDYVEFYRPFFSSHAEAVSFIKRAGDNTVAIKILHQGARMIWLADYLLPVTTRPNRPQIQVMFYIIAAEACAKLARNYVEDGESKKHVRIFFEELCSSPQRQRLTSGFFKDPDQGDRTPLTIDDIVNVLYEMRCDVVHEGRYFEYILPDEGDLVRDQTDLIWINNQAIEVSITLSSLRQVILEGVIETAKNLISKEPETASSSVT